MATPCIVASFIEKSLCSDETDNYHCSRETTLVRYLSLQQVTTSVCNIFTLKRNPGCFYHHSKYQTVSLCLIIICCIISVSCDDWCSDARSCVGQSLTDPGTNFVHGYKAAFGPSSSFSGGGIQCSGSHSCHSMSSIVSHSSSILCGGSDSCSNTTIQSIQSKTSEITCRGTTSCSGSDISAQNDAALFCAGYQSCVNANIHGIEDVNAQGQYSLLNAIIDTIDNVTNTTNLYLEGSLAAYGATLFCRLGHICNIYCQALNSCFKLYIDCEGTCNVIKESDLVIAPNFNLTDMDNHTLFESESMIGQDESCLWTFDDVYEQYNTPNITITADNESALCCRGDLSCNAVDHIGFQSKTKQDLICSGAGSCGGSTITSNNNSVFCQAYRSCKTSTIINAAYVYCSGKQSCEFSTITKASFVECPGALSCEAATFISGGNNLNVYFTGSSAGQELTLHCNDTDFCNIYCIAAESCRHTMLFCNGNCNVECDVSTSWCPVLLSIAPSQDLSINPSQIPSIQPTHYPSLNPSQDLSINPSQIPSIQPTQYPSLNPSQVPLMHPTISPSQVTLYFNQTPLIDTKSTSQTTSDFWTAVPTISTPNEVTVTDIVTDISGKDNDNILTVILWSVIGCIVIYCAVTVIILYFRKHKQRAEANQKMIAIKTNEEQRGGVLAEIVKYSDDGANKAFDHMADEKKNEGESNHELVRIWLTSTVGLGQYFELFIKNGYDSLEFISKITDVNQLAEIGIILAGHRTQIISEIQSLKNQENQGHQQAIQIASEHSSDHSNDDLWEPQLPLQTEGVEMAQNTTVPTSREPPETQTGDCVDAR